MGLNQKDIANLPKGIQEQIRKKIFRTISNPKEFIPVIGDYKKMREDAIQACYFEWVLHEENRLLMPELDLIYAIPNGSNKSKTERWLHQVTGLRSGVPDVHIAVSRKHFFGFYIEFKTWNKFRTKNQGCSESQLEWHERLRKFGHKVDVLVDPIEAINQTKLYLGY